MGPSFTRPRFATVVYHNGPCNKSGIPENEALPRKQGWGRAVCKSHTTPREQPFTRGGAGMPLYSGTAGSRSTNQSFPRVLSKQKWKTGPTPPLLPYYQCCI